MSRRISAAAVGSGDGMKLYWALQWRSNNRLDGEHTHIVHEQCLPVLFRTRKEARVYAGERFGYIKNRSDLRREPHGWRMPKPVHVCVSHGERRWTK